MVKYLGSLGFTSQKGVVPACGRLFAVVSSMPFARPFAFLCFTAVASAAESADTPWVVAVTEENDKFTPTNKDRYYTQGLKVSVNRDDGVFFSVTQEINTPSDTLNPPSASPPFTDLPYSGALYFGYGYGRVLERGGRRDSLFSVEAKFGVIGPAAGGETVQNKFHDLIGTPQAVGWGTQLPNELLFNLDGEFRHRFDLDGPDKDTRDLIARAVLQLGTMRTEAIFGAQFRWGSDLGRSWGHAYIRHSNGYDPSSDLRGPGKDGFAFWGFADTQVEVVVRNYATDGTNFRDSRGVVRSPIVLQAALGFTAQVSSCSLTYFCAARTKEFETQDGFHLIGGLKGQFLF
jgi:hypothetical protein